MEHCKYNIYLVKFVVSVELRRKRIAVLENDKKSQKLMFFVSMITVPHYCLGKYKGEITLDNQIYKSSTSLYTSYIILSSQYVVM